MDCDEPLPLIERSDVLILPDSYENGSHGLSHSSAFYGYTLLISSWILFMTTINSLFHVWSYIIHPLSLSEELKHLHTNLSYIFETIDDYVLKCWCIYIVFWWWSLISWVGLKLFRHSKGIQT